MYKIIVNSENIRNISRKWQEKGYRNIHFTIIVAIIIATSHCRRVSKIYRKNITEVSIERRSDGRNDWRILYEEDHCVSRSYGRPSFQNSKGAFLTDFKGVCRLDEFLYSRYDTLQDGIKFAIHPTLKHLSSAKLWILGMGQSFVFWSFLMRLIFFIFWLSHFLFEFIILRKGRSF